MFITALESANAKLINKSVEAVGEINAKRIATL